jgi:hypothetical protein
MVTDSRRLEANYSSLLSYYNGTSCSYSVVLKNRTFNENRTVYSQKRSIIGISLEINILIFFLILPSVFAKVRIDDGMLRVVFIIAIGEHYTSSQICSITGNGRVLQIKISSICRKRAVNTSSLGINSSN